MAGIVSPKVNFSFVLVFPLITEPLLVNLTSVSSFSTMWWKSNN